MDQEVALVINGYVQLTGDQQNELIGYINDFNGGTQVDKNRITRESSIYKSTQRMDLGPGSSALCPCCGR